MDGVHGFSRTGTCGLNINKDHEALPAFRGPYFSQAAPVYCLSKKIHDYRQELIGLYHKASGSPALSFVYYRYQIRLPRIF